jgi:antitoxin PrlF
MPYFVADKTGSDVMSILTVTAKGQVTLRKEVLQHLGVQPGDKIVTELLPNGKVEVHAAKRSGSIENFIGLLSRPDQKPLSVEEMNEIIADGWAGLKK